MNCRFKRSFLKDLAELPAYYRKKIERLVFDELPGMDSFPEKVDLRKM